MVFNVSCSSDGQGNALVRVYATIGSSLGAAPLLYASSPTVTVGAGQSSLSLGLGRMTLPAPFPSLSLCLLSLFPCMLLRVSLSILLTDKWYDQS
jgi:hypothetical protein